MKKPYPKSRGFFSIPINISWKSMIQGMAKQYKTGKVICRDFTDGSTSCASSQAWNVFFATLRKHKWDEKSSRPHSVTETVFTEAIEETMKDILNWFAESVGYCGECNK